ncbi:GTPase activating factor [Coemansia sp. RSA 1199]|nr:GTPase activating factor [Coemansia sp. RSA 1199]
MPSAALQRIKRAVSTYRLSSSRLSLSPKRPYATDTMRQLASVSAQHLASNTPSELLNSIKIGYLLVCDRNQGSNTYYVELCAITQDGHVVRVTEDGSRVTRMFDLAHTARRLTSKASRSRRAIEVIDMSTGQPVVYLQATSKTETKAWLLAMRNMPYRGECLTDRHNLNDRRLDGWEAVDVGTRRDSCAGSSLCSRPNHRSPRTTAMLLGAQSPKPPLLVQALIEALLPIARGFPSLVDACSSGAIRHMLFSSPCLPFARTMNARLTDPDVHALVASVLYLRMVDTDGVLSPAPHALVPGSIWQPYIGVLARCAGYVSLFLFDIDEGLVIEVAEVDVSMLSTQDIQPVDDSVFSESFCFSINLETVVHNLYGKVDQSLHLSPEARRASLNSMQGSGSSSPFVEPAFHPHPRSRSFDHATSANSFDETIASSGPDTPQTSTTPSMLYLAAPRAYERNSWMSKLRQHAQVPLHDSIITQMPTGLSTPLSFRVERSLWIKVHEAQGLSRTHSTVAAVLADGHLLAQTEVAANTNSPRWENASHCFGGLGPIRQSVHVLVWQNSQSGANCGLVGYCQVPIAMLRRGHSYDGWYPLSYGKSCTNTPPLSHLPLAHGVRPARRRSSGKLKVRHSKSQKSLNTLASDAPVSTITPSLDCKHFSDADTKVTEPLAFRSGDVHIQLQYDETIVLQRLHYTDVVALLLDTDPTLIFKLTTMVPSSADWLVETVTKISVSSNCAEGWIEALVCHELAMHAERDPTLLFRGTSVATRAIDTIMKIVGLEFIDQLIGNVVRNITSNEYACEVDPTRLADNNSIGVHWDALTRLLHALWQGIENGANACPPILRRIFACLRSSTAAFYSNHVSSTQVHYSCISGFVFLRLLCPAMLSPKSFGLVSRPPSSLALRTLTLLAKGIQCTANLSDFSAKEPYMQPMNVFVQTCIPRLKLFIDSIASEDTSEGTLNLFADQTGWAVDGEHELAVFCAFVYSSRNHIRESLTAQFCSEAPTPIPGACVSLPASPTTSGPHFGPSHVPLQGVGLNINSGSLQPQQLSDVWARRKAGHISIDITKSDCNTSPSSPSTLSTPKPNTGDTKFAQHFGTPLDFIACSAVERLVRECETVQKCVNECLRSSPMLMEQVPVPPDEFTL